MPSEIDDKKEMIIEAIKNSFAGAERTGTDGKKTYEEVANTVYFYVLNKDETQQKELIASLIKYADDHKLLDLEILAPTASKFNFFGILDTAVTRALQKYPPFVQNAVEILRNTSDPKLELNERAEIFLNLIKDNASEAFRNPRINKLG
jgi:isopropylmalate/homocitrate/citramalate synthase